MMISVQGYTAGATGLSCLTSAGVKSGTQVLVVRRASTCAIAVAASDTASLDSDCDPQVTGAPYLQASTCTSSTELGASGMTNHFILDTDSTKFTAATAMHQKNCLTSPPGWAARIHQYRTHIYFIANDDKSGDGIPTLKRLELGASGFTIVPLVEGIENWHIEYGIDIPSGTPAQLSGTPAVYTPDPDNYSSCSGVACMNYWRNIVAAKIYVLARNTLTSGNYSTTKTYNMGLLADGTTVNTVGPFTDAYKRHVYESTVRLNNVAGRNTQ
jgi:type IV pilus assembly protein PilW